MGEHFAMQIMLERFIYCSCLFCRIYGRFVFNLQSLLLGLRWFGEWFVELLLLVPLFASALVKLMDCVSKLS